MTGVLRCQINRIIWSYYFAVFITNFKKHIIKPKPKASIISRYYHSIKRTKIDPNIIWASFGILLQKRIPIIFTTKDHYQSTYPLCRNRLTWTHKYNRNSLCFQLIEYSPLVHSSVKTIAVVPLTRYILPHYPPYRLPGFISANQLSCWRVAPATAFFAYTGSCDFQAWFYIHHHLNVYYSLIIKILTPTSLPSWRFSVCCYMGGIGWILPNLLTPVSISRLQNYKFFQ